MGFFWMKPNPRVLVPWAIWALFFEILMSTYSIVAFLH
jgi:hypothetical protein